MSILKKIFSGVIAINVIALLFISTGPNTKANNFVEEDINIAVARDYDMQTNPEPDLHCISHVGTDGVLYVTRFRPNFGSNGAIGNWYSTNGETLTGSAMTYHNGYFYHSHTGLDGKIYTRKSPNCRQNTWTAWQSTGEPGEFTRNAPALASHDGYLFQAHVGNNNGVYVRKTTNGSNWT